MKKSLIFLFCSAMVFSCARVELVDVGLIASVTGNYSPLLNTARNGSLLAVEEINESDQKMKLNLITKDDQSLEDITKDKAKELLNGNVKFFVLSITSGNYAAAEDVLNGEDILVLTPTVSSNEFSGKDDNLIRFSPDVSMYAEALAEHTVVSGLGAVVIIYDSNNLTYAQSMIEPFSRIVKSRIENSNIHLIDYNSTQSPSFSDLGAEVIKIDPETVLIITSAFDAALIFQHIASGDYLKLVAPWAVSDELIQNGGRAVEGVVAYYKDEQMRDEEGYNRFYESYKERFEVEPTYQSMKGYETIMFLYDILKLQSDHSPGAVKAAMIKAGGYAGFNFNYEIDDNGDCRHPLHPYIVKNGEFIYSDNH